MHLQCPAKEQGKKCKNRECPACLDSIIEEELDNLEETLAQQANE